MSPGKPARRHRLPRSAQGANVIFFELPEVVFGLGVHQAECDVGVGLAINVRDAVRVAVDGDRRLSGGGRGCKEKAESGDGTPVEAGAPPDRIRHGLLRLRWR